MFANPVGEKGDCRLVGTKLSLSVMNKAFVELESMSGCPCVQLCMFEGHMQDTNYSMGKAKMLFKVAFVLCMFPLHILLVNTWQGMSQTFYSCLVS